MRPVFILIVAFYMTNSQNIENEVSLHFDGDNSYPDCECCGDCCHIAVLSITNDELETMHKYIDEHNIKLNNRAYECCPMRSLDGKCMIWEARPQICKLYNCKVPRSKILDENDQIHLNEDANLVVLYDEFIGGPQPLDTIECR